MKSCEVNPFSTKFWTPGTLPFEFDDDKVDAESLLERFFAMQNRHGIAQIVGPHGSGKSTLLASLGRAFRIRHFNVIQMTLHDRQRSLSPDFRPPGCRRNAVDRNIVFFLDGYEQLSLWMQTVVRLRCWNRAAGLILTTHTPAPGIFGGRIPILYRTVPRLDRFQNIVRRLTAGTDFSVDEKTPTEIFHRHHGNFRNAFFELYDLFAD